MSNTPTCCRALFLGIDSPVKSPFSRMIVLDWFDGPTYGVVQCSVCGTSYKFSTLTADDGSWEFSSWNEGREIYIFGLSRLEQGMFRTIIKILSETQAPQWPEWHRATYRDYQHKQDYLRADGSVNSLLSQVNDIDLVLAVHMSDLLEEVLQSRTVSPDIMANTKGHQWFSFMGFAKPL